MDIGALEHPTAESRSQPAASYPVRSFTCHARFEFELSVVAVVWQRLFVRTEIFLIKTGAVTTSPYRYVARASNLTNRRDNVDIRLSPEPRELTVAMLLQFSLMGYAGYVTQTCLLSRLCNNADESVRKLHADDLCFTIIASYGGNPVPELKQCCEALLRSWDKLRSTVGELECADSNRG